jgi:hypothetical protein
VKTVTGKIFTLDLEPAESIKSILAKINYNQGIPQDQKRPILADKQLKDGRNISDYNTLKGSTLHLNLSSSSKFKCDAITFMSTLAQLCDPGLAYKLTQACDLPPTVAVWDDAMMNGTCELKEWSDLSEAPASDANFGDHRNMQNILPDPYLEINQVFEIHFSIAPPSTATQNVQKNDLKVGSYSNDPKT